MSYYSGCSVQFLRLSEYTEGAIGDLECSGSLEMGYSPYVEAGFALTSYSVLFSALEGLSYLSSLLDSDSGRLAAVYFKSFLGRL